MDYKDFKEITEYDNACEAQCNKFHEATRAFRFEKVEKLSKGIPLFKKILLKFYGLEKVTEKYYLIPNDYSKHSEIGGFFSEYDAKCFMNSIYGKDDFKIEKREVDDLRLNYYSPYDTIRYKFFLSWVKNIEKNGLKIKKPWAKYNLKYYPAEQFQYAITKKEKWRRATRIFRHKYHNPIWNGSDSFDEVIRITIAGVYHWLWGNGVEHRQTAHQMWVYRKKLLKCLDFDVWWEYYNIKIPILEKYGIPYEIEIYDTDNYLKNGISAIGRNEGKYFHAGINPRLVETIVDWKKNKDGIICETGEEHRARVLEKIEEIENFIYETKIKNYGFEQLRKDWMSAKKDAYEYRAEYEERWDD